jgi:hypothetical protein
LARDEVEHYGREGVVEELLTSWWPGRRERQAERVRERKRKKETERERKTEKETEREI